jgi:metal-responsive CopG/Arc/MetJ family transcriptional regulator
MLTRQKVVRQSITLPASLAKEVQKMAKRQHLSASRMLLTLVNQGVQARKQQRKALFAV